MDQGRATKVLVIDDEASTLKMLRLLLRTYGYAVLTAPGGAAGLDLFAKENPEIVLTDIRMPGMDGLEVLKRLKELNPDVEVIVFTGHGDMDLAIRSLQNTASDFINKPVRQQALEVALKRAEEKIALKRRLKDYTLNLETTVAEATSELTRTYRQLETLYEISKLLGEAASLSAVIGLLEEKIRSVAGLDCVGIVALDSSGRGTVPGIEGSVSIGLSPEIIGSLKSAERPHPLSPEEIRQIAGLPSEGGVGQVFVFPVPAEGSGPVAFAFASVPTGAEEDFRMVSLLLSQAAGAVRRAVLQEEELIELRGRAGGRDRSGKLIGRHEKMQKIYNLIETIADSEAGVLIQGESGTGKELAARRIHELSHRKNGPFVVINCAAIPPALIESELFGHEKGAFTGAVHARKGSFELAHSGTIFLDEIGEIPLAAQVKLLRVLQFREFQRVGGETLTRVDVRVIAATSRNLKQEMERGNFREDLYYRLHIIPIVMPPLRERMTDVPLLAGYILRKLSASTGKKIIGVAPDAMNVLMRHRWPGNVRELENALEHAFILARGETIRTADLPASVVEGTGRPRSSEDSLDEIEKEHLVRVLKECGGNKIQAARRLRISRSTLYRKLEQYGLAADHDT